MEEDARLSPTCKRFYQSTSLLLQPAGSLPYLRFHFDPRCALAANSLVPRGPHYKVVRINMNAHASGIDRIRNAADGMIDVAVDVVPVFVGLRNARFDKVAALLDRERRADVAVPRPDGVAGAGCSNASKREVSGVR